MNAPRFPQAVRHLDEAMHYFGNREQQMRPHGFVWRVEKTRECLEGGKPWAAVTVYTDRSTGRDYQSLFVYEHFQHQGRYKNYVAQARREKDFQPIVTMTDCGIETYLSGIGLKEGTDYRVLRGITDTPEYHKISAYYGDEKAKRSGVYLMEHIDQGLYILKRIGASDEAMRAFCLHPLYQADADLQVHFQADLTGISARVIILAMEYRNIANGYLSSRTIRSLDDIRLSPLPEVNQMLIADKIQNFKDFALFHRGTHARHVELESYFIDWLKKLDVNPRVMTEIFEDLSRNDASEEARLFYRDQLATQVIRSVQVNLLRDSQRGLEIYMQRRLPTMSSYPDMWVPMGGKVEEDKGKSIFETAADEAKEEGGIDLYSRVLFQAGTEMSFAETIPGGAKKVFLYPKLVADGNGLSPHINSPQEAYQDAWWTVESALAVHDEAVAKHPDAPETRRSGAIAPGALKTIELLRSLQAQGLTTTTQVLHHFQRYGS